VGEYKKTLINYAVFKLIIQKNVGAAFGKWHFYIFNLVEKKPIQFYINI
jgi:hypothetical protein